jgi:hypothetical protein
MKRAGTWLVSILLAVSALGATAQGAFAYRGDVWSNSNGFSVSCLGFTDTYPASMYSMARSQMALLGYSPLLGGLGASFTKANLINTVLADYGLYVHTHGDNYWAASGYPNVDSAILQDPGSGRCNDSARDMIRSSSIKTATSGTPYSLVIMSTCKLGANSSTMPGAFQMAKTKAATNRTFYLGYVNTTYDSSAARFEYGFFSYLNGAPNHTRTVYQAFTYAQSIGGYSSPDSANPFQANWWGNPNYNGTP